MRELASEPPPSVRSDTPTWAPQGVACATEVAPQSTTDAAPVPPTHDTHVPWQAAHNTVELARALFGAQVVALFRADAERPILLASHAMTQATLDAASDAWRRARSSRDTGALPRRRDEPPAVVLPCSDEQGVAGFIYLGGESVSRPAYLPVLLPFSRVLACLLRGVVGVEQASPGDGEPGAEAGGAVELYVLMERHEWNVARVARALSVTRMTVYNRLKRAGLARKRVSKTPRRKGARAPAKGPEAAQGAGSSGDAAHLDGVSSRPRHDTPPAPRRLPDERPKD